MTNRKLLPILLLSLALLLALLMAIFFPRLARRSAAPAGEITSGVQYLEALEARDPAEVDAIIKENRRLRLEELRDERLRQLNSGEISVWSLFEDYALLGDSRAVGYSFYGFLPEERVMAKPGATISEVEQLLPRLTALNPSTVFLIYGINDICCGTWHDGETYGRDYGAVADAIHAALPDASLYISSMLPAHSADFQQYDIAGFNAATEEMCAARDFCHYVDNTDISETYSDLWEPDGIHVVKDFYPHWAVNLMMAVYNSALSADAPVPESAESVPA